MNKRRLLTLARFLRTNSRRISRRFDMQSWSSGDFCGKPNEPQHHACQTSACAVGWGTTIPSFRRAGLRLQAIGAYDIEYLPGAMELRYKHLRNYHACAEFFGVSEKESVYLFGYTTLYEHSFGSGWGYGLDRDPETPTQVARRIERFVKENGKIHYGV